MAELYRKIDDYEKAVELETRAVDMEVEVTSVNNSLIDPFD